MSVIQSQQKELRFLKRKALEQESRIIGNALRDQIRAYGVDCIYYKLKETGYTDFKNIIDSNTILRRAYGYDQNPDYTMSAHMITYAEVQTDIFQLNKYGHIPTAEIEFNFDKIDFACALATKYGQLKEYQIEKTPIFFEVPPSSDTSAFPLSVGAWPYTQDLSGFPYNAYKGNPFLKYYCEMLTGWFNVEISGYEPNQMSSIELSDGTISSFNLNECTISCIPYQHTDFNVQFPANEDLYRSLKYKIQNDSFIETKLYLTYVVNELQTAKDGVKNVLSGYVHGSLLFFDIDMIGKYVNLIRPAIGDLIAIDFPSDSNREIYEITDCFDKQLTQDGISPLLHNYIWKCKAKRYVNAHEELAPVNEADERVEEHQLYDQLIDGTVTDQISMYDTLSGDVKEDSVYGGYDTVIKKYDNQIPRPSQIAYEYTADGSEIFIMKFKMGSKLMTNGYDLIFVDNTKKGYVVTTSDLPINGCVVEQDIRWLKATDNQIVFVNINGESNALAVNYYATKDELEICLNNLYDKTLDTGKPANGQEGNFFTFKGTRSYLWSDGIHLFAKLASSEWLFCIV